MSTTLPGPDGQPRCRWCLGSAAYVAYHDSDWGLPVADGRVLFEKLSLEAFQSGLSWRTILDKRAGFHAVFEGFDPARIAAFGPADVARLLRDAGIVRHRGKMEATVSNARALLAMGGEAAFAAHVWRHEPAPGQGQTAAAALSGDLRKLGWAFVGPTTVHAFLQAAGLVNDHAPTCLHHATARTARAAFTPPSVAP